MSTETPLVTLPMDETDYAKWPDSVFRALEPGHVNFFSDESVQEFNLYLIKNRETTLSGLVGADTERAFSNKAFLASRDQRIARDKATAVLEGKYDELKAENREYKRMTGEHAEALQNFVSLQGDIDAIREDPGLSAGERARKLAGKEAKREAILAEIDVIENSLDARGWLRARTRRRSRAGSAASGSTVGTSPGDELRREMKETRDLMRRNELPWIEVLGRAMCVKVVNQAASASDRGRTWQLAIQRLGHWADFAMSEEEIGGLIGHKLSIDAGAFLTEGELDASESEAGCAMLMYARSGDPLLRNVFWHRSKPFDDVKVSLKFEYITVVGARPDQLWLVGEDDERQPLLVHEHKSPAVFPGRIGPIAGRTSVWVTGNSQLGVRKVLEQAYGYMIALGLRYGAISTTEFTWFLKRDDDDRPGAEQPAGLLVSRPYESTAGDMESVHIGYLTALLHALRAGDAARDQFPAHDSPLGQHVSNKWRAQLGATNLERGAGTPYERDTYDYFANIKRGNAASGGPGGLLPLHRSAMADLLPVPYDKAYERVRESAASSVLRLRRPDGLDFIIKTPVAGTSDGLTAAEAVDAVARETNVYAALFALQGSTVPPLVYGGALMSEDDGGWHAVITLDVGTSLDQLEAPLDKEVQARALAALARVHAAGCLHGDVALRNFVLCPDTGAVRVIDFARAELVRAKSSGAKRAAAAEVAELRECLGLPPADASSQFQSQQQASSSSRDLA